MDGPSHYAKAEQYLQAAHHLVDALDASEETDRAVAATIAVAQVHATLALAAATGLAATDPHAGLRTADAIAWERACSAVPAASLDDEDDAEQLPRCGSVMNPGEPDGPVCVLEAGHSEYHADGHGNRWEP